MDSGILGADELPKKHKWSENSKVYTRKFHRKPKNSNSNLSNATVVSGSNYHGETSCRIVVGSNGGRKDCALNGPRINVENIWESVVEELPNNDNGWTIDNNGKANSGNVIEEDPMKVVNVVGTHNKNMIEELPSNGNIDKEVPVNRNIVDGRSNDVNNTENEIDKVCDSENNVEEVCNGEHRGKEVPHIDTNAEEVPRGETVAEEVPHNVTNVEEVPHGETNVDKVLHGETNVDKVLHDVTSVEEVPHDENKIDEAPGDDIEIEDVPPSLSQHEKHPTQIETVSVTEGSLSHSRFEPALPNGHDCDENLENVVVREERPMVTHIEDRLNIRVSAAKSRKEVRDLKRKLEGELDQLRKMARKLEAKETQISSVAFDSGRLTNEPRVVGRLHIPVNGGMSNRIMRPTQELGSASYGHSRPFSELSVSVIDNSYHGVGEIPHEKEKRTPKANQYYRNSDFLLGKERLPPADSNRKAKSSGGGKKHGRGGSELGFGFDKKINKKCSELLQKLRNHKHGWVFNQPVDVKRLGLHDYFDIIKHPMDLGSVKTRLTNHWYKIPREFAEDVRLTFSNAMTYNPEGQDVHIMAKELLRIFEEKWPSIDMDYDRRLRQEMFRELDTPTPTSRRSYDPSHVPMHMPLPPPALHPAPSFHETRNLDRSQSMPVRPDRRPKVTTPRTPAPKKPKAKDPNKRDMTFDEKQKLTTNLQCLPSEKLNVIVQIIKKRNTALSLHDDEIEVDIDNVDTETLWELDRFVTNYKKSLSKHKRKAEQAVQARALAAQAIPEAVPPAPPIVEAPTENRADEGNVATTSPPAQQEERHNDNASDSSSSSSSSSDSGSSSSDSDSSSSSDSGSDDH